MKVYAKDVSGKRYLTSNKEYEVINDFGGHSDLLEIIDDEGDRIRILITGCSHLNGKEWTVIND